MLHEKNNLRIAFVFVGPDPDHKLLAALPGDTEDILPAIFRVQLPYFIQEDGPNQFDRQPDVLQATAHKLALMRWPDMWPILRGFAEIAPE